MPTNQSTPPPVQSQVESLLSSLQSTKPNKGSGSSRDFRPRVEGRYVKHGIEGDMKERQLCDPQDMVRYLLALCCQDDSPTAPVSYGGDLNKCFEDCWGEAVKVANSAEMKKRLSAYKSSSRSELKMYAPFSNAFNYGLERLSTIHVHGLPKFKNHIVFVPWGRGLTSNRDLGGSRFQPDIALMPLNTVCNYFNIECRGRRGISQVVNQIPKKVGSKKDNPRTLGWGDVYTVVEMKRGPKDEGSWPPLRIFTARVATTETAEIDDNKLFEPRRDLSPLAATEEDTLPKAASTKSEKGRKRTASVAGVKSGTSGNKSKRPRQQNFERSAEGSESKQSPQEKSGKNTRKSLAIQNGIYAAEKFSDSLSVSHVLNLLVQDDSLWISWIDREGVIFSSSFSFFTNLPLMLVLLLTLQRFGRRQWGYISELTSRDRVVSLYPVSTDGSLCEDEVDINFYPDDKIHSGWSLLGRATTVVGASDMAKDSPAHVEEEHFQAHGGDEADGVVIDDSYEDRYLTPDEVDVDEQFRGNSPSETTSDLSATEDEEQDSNAEEEGGEGEGENGDDEGTHGQLHDLVLKVSWPEASRHEEWKVISHARTLGNADEFIKGHIPEAKYARDLNHYSTRHIRDFLRLKTAPRTLRLIVMPRLYPLHDLSGEALWNAFWQCFVCHYRLWINGIHHGDISFNNLMYYITPQTNAPQGVLNDYDLASWVGNKTVNNDRTGTIPFMALDLLNGGLEACVPRLYRHDAESFTWVLAYLSVATIEYTRKGGSVKFSWPPEMDAWFDENRVAHRASKQSLGLQYGDEVPVPERYARYTATTRQLIAYWVNRYASSSTSAKRGAAIPGDEDAAAALKALITKMEILLEGDMPDVFVELRTLLLRAIDMPTVLIV